jgi:tetratricopeptide (TPR) repeat protein
MNVKKRILIIFLLFIVAFLPRIFFLNQLNKSLVSDLLVLDSADYDRWAMEIARGNWVGKDVFYAMPFYPYFLGVIYFLFGYFLSMVRLIQICIGSINCVLVYWLAKRIFGSAVAIVSFLTCAFFGLFILYDNMLIATSLIIFSYLALFNLISSFIQKQAVLKIFLIGLTLGISCLIAANALMFTLVFIFWIYLYFFKSIKKIIGYSLVFFMGVSLTILPVSLRNYIVSKDFVLITAHGGLNFYLGNNPLSDGANVDLPLFSSGSRDMIEDSIAFAEKAGGRKMKPSEISGFWFQKGIEFIKGNPNKFTRLFFTKVRLFLMGYELPDVFLSDFYSRYVPILKIFGSLPFKLNLFFPLFILGLIASIRQYKSRKPLLPIYLFLGSYIFSTAMFLMNTRYKLPVAPLVIIFASYFVVYLSENLKRKKYKSVSIWVISFLVLYPILNDKNLYKRYKPNQSAGHVYLGNHLLEKGQFKSAIEEFKKAVQKEPKKAEAHNMLGLGYLNSGDLKNAEVEFMKSIKLKPELIAPYNNLGQIYLEKRDYVAAEEYFKKSLNINSNQPAVRDILNRIKSLKHIVEQ